MVQAGRQGAQGRWEALQAGLARAGSSDWAGPEQSPDEQEEVRDKQKGRCTRQKPNRKKDMEAGPGKS